MWQRLKVYVQAKPDKRWDDLKAQLITWVLQARQKGEIPEHKTIREIILEQYGEITE